MRTIIHDLDDLNLSDDLYILDYKDSNNCIGCFNCWFNSKCIYNDKFNSSSNTILKSDTLIIVTKNNYGTYSSKVKKILERNISIVSPFFVIRENSIHHKTRINNKLNFIVIVYGNINEKEKYFFKELVNRNRINFNLDKPSIYFLENKCDVRRKLNELIY